MGNIYKELKNLIELFVNGKINGEYFEKCYSELYDFEELSDVEDSEFFGKVRSYLEHFSSCKSDLTMYPDFYINEEKLKEVIINLKA